MNFYTEVEPRKKKAVRHIKRWISLNEYLIVFVGGTGTCCIRLFIEFARLAGLYRLEKLTF